MSEFVNYVLTLGQTKSPKFGFASLGLSLERYGDQRRHPGRPRGGGADRGESAAYACGDLTPSEVAAGQTTPTCGVTNVTAAVPPNNGRATGISGASPHRVRGGAGGHRRLRRDLGPEAGP